MAAKHRRTLFEAIEAQKEDLTRGPDAVGAAQKPQASGDLTGPPLRPRPPARPETPGPGKPFRVPPAAMVALAVVVVGILIAVSVAYFRRQGQFGKDGRLPPIKDVSQSEARTEVLDNTGPAPIGHVQYTYNQDAESGDNGGNGSQPVPVAGGTENTLGGPSKIRVFRTSAAKKSELDKAAAFLDAKGIPTVREFRRGFYFLYSKQTFPSDTVPEAVALRDRIRNLGEEFSRASGIGMNEFASAFIVTRTSRN